MCPDVQEEVIERVRKTTAEECPFCVDAPIKENGKRCVGVCRNPQVRRMYWGCEACPLGVLAVIS